MKASIIFFPNLPKKSSRNGKIPLYCRVIVNRTKAENRLLAEVPETDLLKWDPITMRFTDRGILANHILNGLDQKFLQFVTLNAERIRQLQAREILDHVMGQESRPKTGIIDYVDAYFNNSILNNSNISTGTVKNYRKAVNHLKSFLRHRKTEKMELSELTNSLALEFKDYLLGNIPGKLTKGMTEPSAAGIVKKFRTILTGRFWKGNWRKTHSKL